jgi:hypothetical protein
MSLIDETRYLERRRFFNGERLQDTDLNDQEEFHRQMRWLHNYSLHQPGVGNGYAVTGQKYDREVKVGPGYAIDAQGREIVLTHETTLAVPPVAGDAQGRPVFYYLTAAYPDAAALGETEQRQGLCGNRGAVRLAERPDLCWVQLRVDPDKPTAYTAVDSTLQDKITGNLLIPLAFVQVFQCRLNATLQEDALAPQRSARPQRLPYLAGGIEPSPKWVSTFVPDLTLPTQAPALGQFPVTVPAPFRLSATVDTGAAMFGAIPRYTVRVSGERLIKLPGPPQAPVFLEPVIDLNLDPNATNHVRFEVKVSVLIWVRKPEDWPVVTSSLPTAEGRESRLETEAKKWSIHWLGVEG